MFCEMRNLYTSQISHVPTIEFHFDTYRDTLQPDYIVPTGLEDAETGTDAHTIIRQAEQQAASGDYPTETAVEKPSGEGQVEAASAPSILTMAYSGRVRVPAATSAVDWGACLLRAALSDP
jgi:hypothetical protein